MRRPEIKRLEGILFTSLILLLLLLHTNFASTLLVQSRSIKHRVIPASNKLSGQVRAVMNGEQIPSIDGANHFARRGDQRQGRIIKAVVMTSSAVDDIPWRSGVVQLLGHAIGDSGVTLVEMLVAVQDKIDAVLEEERLECCLALEALRGADVPRTVAGCDDPWGLLTVHRGEVLLQPLELGAGGGEGAGVLGARAAWEIGCVGEVGFGVELDEVDHSVVPRVPEVFDTAGLGSRHAVKR